MAEKILVVDDDLDTLRLIGLILERQGYEIIAASGGQQALTLVKREQPDLVILDLMMPGFDGVEVARQLRSSVDTQDILIIMFTAKSQTEDKLEGFDAGADAYLTKPTQPRELIANVKAVLKRSRRKLPVAAREFSHRGHVVGILAAKGGLGVTTLAINLGIALHRFARKSVLVADYRVGCGSIGLDLGYSAVPGIDQLLRGDPTGINRNVINEIVVTHESGVRFLLSSPQLRGSDNLQSSEQFKEITQQIAYLSQYIILDIGTSHCFLDKNIISQCETIILVTEPIQQTIALTKMLLKNLVNQEILPDTIMIALINRLRAGMQLTLGQVQDQLEREVDAIITAAPDLAYQALVGYTPLILRQPDGVSAQQYSNFAQKIFQKSVNV